jgi:hypothetical protein
MLLWLRPRAITALPPRRRDITTAEDITAAEDKLKKKVES